MTTATPTRRAVLALGAATATVGLGGAALAASGITTTVDAATLATPKRTPLGLYLTPTEAHAALQADPEIVFVDVRDPIEISFVGHPAGLDRIIPLRVATHEVDPKSHQYRMQANPDVVADFDALMAAKGKTKADPVFVTCRSGARSAVAARMLIDAGYTNVWNLIEGFEGGKDANGARLKDGWRNAGLPWDYRLAPGVAWEG